MKNTYGLFERLTSETLGIRNLAHSILGHKSVPLPAGQQESQYYDQAFANNPDWVDHYTKSPYYCVWTVIIDRLATNPADRLLEIGCGPGQLARAMHNAAVFDHYTGLDFSDVAVGFARDANPDLNFLLENAVTTELFRTATYDTVVTTEFLEHIEQDLDVIRKIRSGTRFLGTVPNFPYVSHVRHFDNADQVMERYGQHFRDMSVAQIPGVQPNSIFYLIDGIKI